MVHGNFGKIRSQRTKDLISKNRKGKCTGSYHPMWKGGLKKYICKNCSKSFNRNQAKNSKYCSDKCKYTSNEWKELGEKLKDFSHIAWNKGLKGLKSPFKGLTNEEIYGKEKAKKIRKKLSLSHKNIIPWNKGLRGYKSKEEHYNWRGGITSFNKSLRCKSDWKIWREVVFLRDNFTCQNINCEFCNNKKGVELHPHHIKPLSLYPELAFKSSNGISYCKESHIKSGLHKGIQSSIMQKEG